MTKIVLLDIAERIKKLHQQKKSEIIDERTLKIDISRKEFENSIDTFFRKNKDVNGRCT